MSAQPRISRVVVALDASAGSLAAAGAAIELAARLHAELLGIFVEDRVLLELALSPMARQVDALTGASAPLERPEVERQMRVQAGRARAGLARLAEGRGVAWSFSVARGAVPAEIAAAAGDSLVSLGLTGWSIRRRRLGTTVQALLTERRRRTLLLEREVPIRLPLAVVYTGGEVSREALALGLQLVEQEPDEMVVLLGRDPGGELREEVDGAAAEAGARPAILPLLGLRAVEVARRVHHARAGLLIVPVGAPGLAADDLQALLEAVACPVLAVS